MPALRRAVGYLVACTGAIRPRLFLAGPQYPKKGAAFVALVGTASAAAVISCAPVAVPPFAAKQATMPAHAAALLWLPTPKRA